MNTQYTCPVCGSHTFSKPVCLVKTGTLPKATQGLVPWIDSTVSRLYGYCVYSSSHQQQAVYTAGGQQCLSYYTLSLYYYHTY